MDFQNTKCLDVCSVTSAEQAKGLWTKTYNTEGKPDWSHILPYYDEHVVFKDTVQEIHGLEDFCDMTRRLAKRSKNLHMSVQHAVKNDKIIFLDWELTISFKRSPSSIIYGASKLILNDAGKIIRQRDYYDLWGDIYDNIPVFGKVYRKFMKVLFG